MILWYKDISGDWKVLDRNKLGHWPDGRLIVNNMPNYLRSVRMPVTTFYQLFHYSPGLDAWVLQEG
jgi:hypothetical protein